MNQNDLYHTIALLKVPGVGDVLAKQLISHCGSPEEVFRTSKKHLLQISGVGDVLADNLLRANTFDEAEKEMEFCSKNEIEIIPYSSKSYPSRLKQYNDAPVLLFYRGNGSFNTSKVLAIVGTRVPTTYGRSICENIINDLAGTGVTIVSGLAYGVDSVAHKKCVEIGIPTIGVLGHGLKIIYPQDNKQLALQMIEKGGGILTEFTSSTQPDKENFPKRNRIVAGMSDAVLVIESARKGGSLITAEYANAYNKDVFAVPGRVHDKLSEGCNDLIKQNKANLVESAADIIRHMIWEENQSRPIQTSLLVELNEVEKKVVEFIQSQDEVHIDKISFALKMAPSATASLLLELEFKGLIRSLPGKLYSIH